MAERIDYLDDPDAPQANSLVPSANVIVANDQGEILMIRRTDNGNWAVPGGGMDLGESIIGAAVRETAEETGIACEITGLVGIYTDPHYVICYTGNNEVRQEFSIVFTPGRSVASSRRAVSHPSRSGSHRLPWGACRCIPRCASASSTTSTSEQSPTSGERLATPRRAQPS
jgi:8-oxo-dGTP pyrophosphatase MutT (NUDIX family)